MLHHVNLLFRDIEYIFSKDRGVVSPLRLFLDNFKIKATKVFCSVFKIKKTSERFMGLKLVFSDYGAFSHLWREIFILENYYFKSDGNRPFIVDVGSNIGMSICYFKILYPNSEILGFEPDPNAFDLLQKNIKLNNFSGVTVHNVALGSRDGKTEFYQDITEKASGANTHIKDMVITESRPISVVLKRLSPFINKEVDLLKIDAEGAEYDILEEIGDKLRLVRFIVLELHQGKGSSNAPIYSLLKILDNNGFRYAITQTFLSHHSFVTENFRHYAIILDAVRF